MTIEATLQSIDGSLISIAASLEALAGGDTSSKATAKGTTDKPASSKAKGKSGTSKAAASKSATKASKDDGPGIPEVRKALTALAKREDAKAPKALLAKYDATTLNNLDESNYQAVIDDAAE